MLCLCKYVGGAMAGKSKLVLAAALIISGCSAEVDSNSAHQNIPETTGVTPPDKPSDPLQVMAGVAQQICQAPSLVGYRRTVGGELTGSISVSKLLGRLANAGVGVKLKADQDDWEGLLQEDFGEALQSGNACRQQVFNAMLERFSVTAAKKLPEDLFAKLAIGSQIDRAEEIIGKPFRVSEEGDSDWRMYRLFNDNLSLMLYYDSSKNIDCVFAQAIGDGLDGIPLYVRSEGKTDLIFGKSRINFNQLKQTFAECSDEVQSDSYQNVSFAGVVCGIGTSSYKPAYDYVIGTRDLSSGSVLSDLEKATFNLLTYSQRSDDEVGVNPSAGGCLSNAMDAHAYGQA